MIKGGIISFLSVAILGEVANIEPVRIVNGSMELSTINLLVQAFVTVVVTLGVAWINAKYKNKKTND